MLSTYRRGSYGWFYARVSIMGDEIRHAGAMIDKRSGKTMYAGLDGLEIIRQARTRGQLRLLYGFIMKGGAS